MFKNIKLLFVVRNMYFKVVLQFNFTKAQNSLFTGAFYGFVLTFVSSRNGPQTHDSTMVVAAASAVP